MEPSSTRQIVVEDKTIEIDEEGYLKCSDDWSEAVANYLSKEDGIELSKDHWEVINLVRWYFLTYQNCPHPKFICKHLNRKYYPTEKFTVKYIVELFRERPIMRACKYAGIPFTAGCT